MVSDGIGAFGIVWFDVSSVVVWFDVSSVVVWLDGSSVVVWVKTTIKLAFKIEDFRRIKITELHFWNLNLKSQKVKRLRLVFNLLNVSFLGNGTFCLFYDNLLFIGFLAVC